MNAIAETKPPIARLVDHAPPVSRPRFEIVEGRKGRRNGVYFNDDRGDRAPEMARV